MIEDLKQVRDALAESMSNSWQDQVRMIEVQDALATLDRIIAEATPSTDALKILRHVNNWSEIETAPKDGTEILLGRFEDGVIEDVIKDYWYEDRVMAAWAEYPAVFDNSPTHWARFPLLPGCAAPTPAQPEKLDVEALKREADENGARTVYFSDRGWNACIDHLAATYDFVRKEK